MNSLSLNENFHLFANCLPVKGITRSIIYDIGRSNFEYIPNSLYEIITENKNININDILNDYPKSEDKEIILDYFQFLYDNEFIFFSNLKNTHFPEFEINFQKPYNIGSLIFDILDIDKTRIKNLIKIISEIKVECLIFRFIKSDISIIENVMNHFKDIPVRIIQIFTPVFKTFEIDFFEKLISENNRISIVVEYNSKNNIYKEINKGIHIKTKKNIILDEKKIVNISDFDVNLDLYMESKLYNNFFNRRLYIDSKGNIFRYEFDNETFGNIDNFNFDDLFKNKNFKKYWKIKKDDIEICNNCEYRYMCVDGRIPIERKDKTFYFEKECSYNPYNGTWEGNEKHKTLKELGVISNESGFLIDYKKN